MLSDDGHQPFAVVEELATSTVNLRVFFWAASEQYRRGVLELRSRVMTRVKNTLMAAAEVSLPADITEIQFPKELPVLPVALQSPAAPGPAATPAADVPQP